MRCESESDVLLLCKSKRMVGLVMHQDGIIKPTILFDLHNSKKSLSGSHLIKQNFQELQSRLSDYQHIYTDGSNVEDKVGCAYISGSHHEKIRLPDGSSILPDRLH